MPFLALARRWLLWRATGRAGTTVLRVTNPIDASLAARVGAAAARPGPDIPLDQAADAVAALRAASRRAVAYVADITGLTDAADRAAGVPVLVVDRPGFVRANARMVEALAVGTLDASMSRADVKATSAETGLILAFLSSRVLGQFDPFAPALPRGRLLLVAPNVVRFERQLRVKPADFRLWVALHEMTHAVQFAAAGFLADYLANEMRDLISAEVESGTLADVPRLLRALARALRGTPGANIALEVLSDQGRDVMERVTAVMSLLEGHADVVMDAVGERVIPELATIRSRFDARRHHARGREKFLRRLMGFDAKTAQYVDGAAFVRTVVDRAGHAGLAAAFAAPANLPTPTEIAEPAIWVTRVLG
jgi:coenzyme F420 biosynthesis associated uncharacterized protein